MRLIRCFALWICLLICFNSVSYLGAETAQITNRSQVNKPLQIANKEEQQALRPRLSDLMKAYQEAMSKDQPRKAMQLLSQIRELAERERSIGSLAAVAEAYYTAEQRISREEATKNLEREYARLTSLAWLSPEARIHLAIGRLELYRRMSYEGRYIHRSLHSSSADAYGKSSEDYQSKMLRLLDSIDAEGTLSRSVASVMPWKELEPLTKRHGTKWGGTLAGELFCLPRFYHLPKVEERLVQMLDLYHRNTQDTVESMHSAWALLQRSETVRAENYLGFINRYDTIRESFVYILSALGSAYNEGDNRRGEIEHLNMLKSKLCMQGLTDSEKESVYSYEQRLLASTFIPYFPSAMSLLSERQTRLCLTQRFVRQCTVEAYRVPGIVANPEAWLPKQGLRPSWQRTFILKEHPRWSQTTDTLGLELHRTGYYYLMVRALDYRGRTDTAVLRRVVTDKAVYRLEEGTHDSGRIQWFDAKTGRPLQDKQVAIAIRPYPYMDKHKHKTTVRTDQYGFMRVPSSKRDSGYYVAQLQDEQDPVQVSFGMFRYPTIVETKRIEVALQTDRAVYAEGQTVRIYGYMGEQHRRIEEARTLEGRSCEIKILAPTGEVSLERKVQTDHFGRFTLDYTLPKSGLLGEYSIHCTSENPSSNAYTIFRVEAYQKPSFEIEMIPPGQALHFGDSLQIPTSVKTLTGIPVAGARLEYQIVIRRHLWRGWHLEQGQEELPQQSLTTDAEGCATLHLRLEPKQYEATPVLGISHSYYTYTIGLRAIVPTGETLEQSLSISVGQELAQIDLDLPDYIERSELSGVCTFNSHSYEGRPVDQTVVYSIVQGHTDSVRRTGQTKTNIPVALSHLMQGLPSGNYQLKYSILDSGLKPKQRNFTLYSRADWGIDVASPLVAFSPDSTFTMSDMPEVYYASSLPRAYVFYQVKIDNDYSSVQLLRPRAGELNRLIIERPKKPVERIGVRLYTVYEGRLSEYTLDFTRRLPTRRLEIELTSFRDRTQPGNVEEIALRVTREGKPVDAALAAWMYDAALDQIFPIRIQQVKATPLLPERISYGNLLIGLSGREGAPIPEAFYSVGSDNAAEVRLLGKTSGLRVRGVRPLGQEQVAKASFIAADEAYDKPAPAGYSTSLGGIVRSDFAETAFFKPLLKTDSQGVVRWSYRMPDNLTRWSLQLLAHTRDLSTGYRQERVEVYRPLMVKPFLPRVLRVGDETKIAVSLRSEEAKGLSGVCSLELFALYSKEILQRIEQPFELAELGTQTLRFGINTPLGLDSVGIRVQASTDSYTDGEQHMLRILPPVEPTVRTLSLGLRDTTDSVVSLAELFPKTGFRPEVGRIELRLESNPLLLALEAIPVISSPTNDNAVSLSSALYTEALGGKLLSIPGLMSWIEDRISGAQQGIRQGRDSLLLGSPGATPWASSLSGEYELERLQTLRAYFRELAERGSLYDIRILRRLAKLQHSDGAWSWFSGMKPSPSLTLTVMRQLIRARRIESNRELDEIIARGWRALHVQLEQEELRYNEQKRKAKGRYQISNWVVNYLYLLSFMPNEEVNAPSSALKLFYGLLREQAHELSLYNKPAAAVALLSKDRQLAGELIESLRQYLTHSSDGLFYANLSTNSYWWYNRQYTMQTETIEALQAVEPEDIQTLHGLQRWLLEQKRSVIWESTLATTEAIYALTLGHTADQVTNTNQASLVLRESSGATIEAVSERPSIVRYFTRHSYPQTLEIKTKNSSTVWGIASAKYSLPIEEESDSGQELRAKRRYYLRMEREGKPYLQELTQGRELRVGDVVVVRLELSLERAMDFVRLSDPRLVCAEACTVTSGYTYSPIVGLSYYLEQRHEATNFYFDRLERGHYLLEYEQSIVRSGVYQAASAHLQSMYAPEYSATTGFGGRIRVLE